MALGELWFFWKWFRGASCNVCSNFSLFNLHVFISVLGPYSGTTPIYPMMLRHTADGGLVGGRPMENPLKISQNERSSYELERIHLQLDMHRWKQKKGFGPFLEVQMVLRVAGARDCAPCQKWAKREGFVAFSTTTTTTATTPHYTPTHYNYNYTFTTFHYTMLHYTPLHYSTLKYTQLHSLTLHYTTLHSTTLHSTTLHSTTLHYTTLHYTTFHYTTLHYITLHYTTLRYTTKNYTTLHSTTLHYTTLHYITLHYLPLNSTTLHYTKLHYTIPVVPHKAVAEVSKIGNL